LFPYRSARSQKDRFRTLGEIVYTCYDSRREGNSVQDVAGSHIFAGTQDCFGYAIKTWIFLYRRLTATLERACAMFEGVKASFEGLDLSDFVTGK
jgi:hypothetical protein